MRASMSGAPARVSHQGPPPRVRRLAEGLLDDGIANREQGQTDGIRLALDLNHADLTHNPTSYGLGSYT